MTVAAEPAHAHGTAPDDRGRRLQSRHPRRSHAGGGATLPARVPERSARRRDPAPGVVPILHGIVLRVRPARSARKYATIWTAEGSPLKVWTAKQALLLGGYLGQRGHRVDRPLRDALRHAVDSFRARRSQGGRRRPDPGPAALSAVFGIDHGQHRRRARGLDAAHPQSPGAAPGQALPRRPRLHRRPRRARQRALARQRPGRSAGAQFPWPAAAFARRSAIRTTASA